MSLKSRLKHTYLYPSRLVVEKILDLSVGNILFQYKRKDNLFNWYYNAIKHHLIENIDTKDQFQTYNYYEFGVARGGSMFLYMLAVKKFCRDYSFDINRFHIYGFDSFEGLPEAQLEDQRHDWGKGKMVHPVEQIEETIRRAKFPRKNVHLINGFYSDSLTQELKENLSHATPAIVNMDADYYSSTIQALNWIGGALPTGALFRFDDIWAFYGHPQMGVIKAINEFNEMDYGHLTPNPTLGLDSYIYVFARKDFEYT